MYVKNTERIKKRFKRNFQTYNRQAIVQRQVATRLACLLKKSKKPAFDKLMEIGCGTGFLTRELISSFSVDSYILNDLVQSAFAEVMKRNEILKYENFQFVAGDAETIDLPNQLDALVSASTIQWFTSLDTFFKKVNRSLKSNGILAISSYGPENFYEIRETLNTSLTYHSLEHYCHLLHPDFEIIHAEEWQQREYFSNAADVLRHMKHTGVNGVSDTIFTKDKLTDFIENYQTLYSGTDSRVYLTFHPLIIIAKKKS